MQLIQENTFEKVRNKIKEINSKERIIFSSEDDELNRKVLEKLKIDICLLNQQQRKDFLKQRNSGLNQVLAKIAKKNKIIIGINLDEIILAKGLDKSKILARVKQNITLCNKNKVNMIFISKTFKRDKYSLVALGATLGMPTWMTKEFN